MTAVNAWEILKQEPHLQWLEKSRKDINAKIDLKVDFQTWLEERNVGWLSKQVKSHGVPFINTVTEALWYVDGQHDKLHAWACSVPDLLKKFSGYNKPARHRHRLPALSATVLRSLGQQVQQLSLQLWLKKHDDLRRAVESFGDALVKYATFLNEQLTVTKRNQSLLEPVRHTPDTQEVVILNSPVVVEPRYANIYSSLVKALAVAKPYEPIDLSEYEKMSNITQ